MSQCQQSLHLGKLYTTAKWKNGLGDIPEGQVWRLRGERWKMKISLHGVGMIHISPAHNQRQNTGQM